MSTKEEKPTLAGVNIKTRKRNIFVPSDPKSFADAVILIFQDSANGLSLEDGLEAAAKALDTNNELDFNKYGTTLFEIIFAGGRLATGGNLAEDETATLSTNILAANADRASILPYVKIFQLLTRRRSFLTKHLENTLIKLLLSLEFFDQDKRLKLGICTALIFHFFLQKQNQIQVQPENIFGALLNNDRLVAKGSVLEFLTYFFKELLTQNSLDDLVVILTKGKVVNRLLDLFPPSKKSPAGFNEHFKSAGLQSLVDWNVKRELDTKLKELEEAVGKAITADEAATSDEVLELVKQRKTEHELPDAEVLKVLWTSLMKSINMTGKNNQQIMQSISKQVRAYAKALNSFATNARTELALLVHLQVSCYEDNRLLKLFSDIVRLLYELEVVDEDTILHWYKKGSHPKGRNVFLKDIEAFVKWLEEAEEEDEDEEE